MKKNLVKLLLIAGFMSLSIAFASVDDFKNNVFKIDLYKTNSDSVNAVIYTTLPYSVPINVIKKSDTEYTILMPEVKSSLVQTPDLKAVGDLVEKIEVKTQPYSQTPALNGYTKLSFTTLKPLNITTSIEALKLPDIRTNSVNTFLENLDKKTEAPKPVIVAKPTELSKPKTEPAKIVAVKPSVVKPVVAPKPASPARVAKKVSTPKPVQRVSQPARRVASAVEPVRPVKKVQPIKPIVPKTVQKLESVQKTPIVQPEPPAPSEPVAEVPTPTEEVVTTEAPAPEIVEETPPEEAYVEEEYTEEPQPNNLGNILLIVGLVFGVGALAAVFLWYAKKLKQEGAPQVVIDQQKVATEIPQEDNTPQENFEIHHDNFEPSQNDFKDSQSEFELPQEPENIQGFTTEDFIQEQDEPAEDFSQSEFDISEIVEDDFIVEELGLPLTKEDINEMYNEGFEEVSPEIVEDIQDTDFIIENDWGDEFSAISTIEQPEKSIDDLFSGEETTVEELLPELIQPEISEAIEIAEATQTELKVVVQQEAQSDIQSDPLPQENNLGFDIKSSFKINEANAMHLIELDGKTSLIGTMGDEVFILKTFDSLIENPIQSRLYENTADKNVYMVKAGKFKGLIDVSTTAMELAVEL